MLNAIGFSRFLRKQSDFSDALDEADLYISSQDPAFAIPRNQQIDPAARTLGRARARLDVVSMLLQRRLFQQARADDNLVGVNVYSDASPVIGPFLRAPRIVPSDALGDPAALVDRSAHTSQVQMFVVIGRRTFS